jgi:hypothetical protein
VPRWLLIVIALVVLAVPFAWAGAARGDDWIDYNLPATQRPFLVNIPLDCQIPSVGPDSFVLRCRINIGIAPKWIKGEKPVVHLPQIPKKKKKKA